MVSRPLNRQDFDLPTRLRLLEVDADNADARMDQIVRELSSFKKVLTGMLVTFTTATVMLAANLALGGIGG